MAVASPEVLARMPLAEAVLTLWCWVADADYLNEVFEENRGRCYEKILSFSPHGSPHPRCPARTRSSAEKALNMPVTVTSGASFNAAYGKLGRLPIPVSTAFLSGCTARLCEVFPQAEMAQVPIQSLAAFRPIIFDGKAIKNVAKRLKALRGTAGRAGRAKFVEAMDLRTAWLWPCTLIPMAMPMTPRFVGDLVPKAPTSSSVVDCGWSIAGSAT